LLCFSRDSNGKSCHAVTCRMTAFSIAINRSALPIMLIEKG